GIPREAARPNTPRCSNPAHGITKSDGPSDECRHTDPAPGTQASASVVLLSIPWHLSLVADLARHLVADLDRVGGLADRLGHRLLRTHVDDADSAQVFRRLQAVDLQRVAFLQAGVAADGNGQQTALLIDPGHGALDPLRRRVLRFGRILAARLFPGQLL